MNKLLIIYCLVITLVGIAAVKFLVTSTAAVNDYRELCYEKYGRDHIKCAFVGE